MFRFRKTLRSKRARIITIAVVATLIFVIAGVIRPAFTLHDSKNPGITYEQARVIESIKAAGQPDATRITITTGVDKGKTVTAPVGSTLASLDLTPANYRHGDLVMLSREKQPDGTTIYVTMDHYRLPVAFWALIGILLLAIIFAGLRGVGSLLGLVLSVIILAKFVVPQILSGHSPYLVTALGIMVISLLGIYIAHGFSRRTSLALASTYITLVIAVGLAFLMVAILHISGISGENTYNLSLQHPGLDIRGLLLCGTIISLIGVLDDVTVGQSTAVEELQSANPKLSRYELYRRGLRIGREHIASLVNTLVLVYIGASFIFVVYLSALSPFPMLVNLNSELLMEEVLRSLVGSAALILAVPVSTLLAARFLKHQ